MDSAVTAFSKTESSCTSSPACTHSQARAYARTLFKLLAVVASSCSIMQALDPREQSSAKPLAELADLA